MNASPATWQDKSCFAPPPHVAFPHVGSRLQNDLANLAQRCGTFSLPFRSSFPFKPPPSTEMGSDAIATKLCSACSQHTLQSLYWGTDNYPLSKDCDLCGLIWDPLGSNPELFDSDGTLPMINICAAGKRGFRSQAKCGIWASHDTRKDELRSLLGSIASKLKTPPINLLDV